MWLCVPMSSPFQDLEGVKERVLIRCVTHHHTNININVMLLLLYVIKHALEDINNYINKQ